jgi:phospholipase/lecithinase/hemolysin
VQKILINVSCILGLLFSYSVSASPPSQLFVFGDSLSDNGNLASVPQYDFLNHPPYDHGFSNGPRAVEVLATQMGLPLKPFLYKPGASVPGTNFAVAGARAHDSGPQPRSPDLGDQVNAFLATFGAADPKALYLVFIGGNDVRDARDATSEANARYIIRTAADAIGGNVRTLLDAGAKTIMVVNAGDLGAIPETRLLAFSKHQPSLIRRSTELTRKFNEELAESIREIKQELHADHLVEFDYFSFARYVTLEYLALGFTDKKDACFSSVTFTFNAGCNNGSNFGQFLYFDEIHLSARTDERVGSAAFMSARNAWRP